jgi:hypothetical protein
MLKNFNSKIRLVDEDQEKGLLTVTIDDNSQEITLQKSEYDLLCVIKQLKAIGSLTEEDAHNLVNKIDAYLKIKNNYS